MKIYYDADCNICNKCKQLVLKLQTKDSKKNNLRFLDINNSEYISEVKKTIVVVTENNNLKKEFRGGAALREIFNELVFPLKLFAYLPIFFLTFLYNLLRDSRNRFSKNICKIEK